jgi:hypothetical protein
MKFFFSITSSLKVETLYETNLIHPYSLKKFQQHQEHDKMHHHLGDFNATNKSNKLPSFIDKYWRFSKTISQEKT